MVEQVGTGATAFTGRNTYTGGTSVASGSLATAPALHSLWSDCAGCPEGAWRTVSST